MKNLYEIKIIEKGIAYKYYATSLPKKNVLGNSFIVSLNCRGIKILQERHIPIYSQEDFRELVSKVLNLPDYCLKEIFWYSPEKREENKVYVNDTLFNPELSEKQKARLPIYKKKPKLNWEEIKTKVFNNKK